MTCRELIDFLMAYLDGELPTAERAEFDGHLGDCPDCRAYLATYQQTVQLEVDAFRDLDREVPEGVPEHLLLAILAARRSGEPSG